MSKRKRNLAWHFCGDKLRDGSARAKPDKIERIDGDLKLCHRGLHWARNPFDALQYAGGAILRLVEPRGTIIEPANEDKGCSSERLIIAEIDASEMLRYFARMQAINCLDNWISDPDQIILEWLFSGDEAARSAARSAAESAAESAAWSAAAWSAETDWQTRHLLELVGLAASGAAGPA